MIVEIPQGSRNKYEMDHDTGEIWLDRTLFTAEAKVFDASGKLQAHGSGTFLVFPGQGT